MYVQAVLPRAQGFLGVSERYGALVADVAGTLRSVAPGGDQVAEAILSTGVASSATLDLILCELRRQAGAVEALMCRVA